MKGYLIILPTFFVAFVLAVFPLTKYLDYVRPEWVAITLVFWVLSSPARAGILLGLCMGLLLDVLHGQILGLNALALSILAYLCMLLHSRMRLYNTIQQSCLVFVLIGLYLLVRYWTESIVMGQGNIALLWPSLGSALIWPVWYNLLSGLRHYFRA